MKLIVNPHKIELEKTPVNEKEIDITMCEFEFSDEITEDYVKEAYFTLKGDTYKQIIVNNMCSIPYEVLTTSGTVEIGVVAYLVEDEEEIKRYNPSPAYFDTWIGSLKDDAENSEPITPSEMEQYEQALQDGLSEVNDKLDAMDIALEEVDNLDVDANKVDTTTTITITKKDGTTKEVQVLDGNTGPAGRDGVDGSNGITPTIGDNGNWYLGDTDTGKPSRGIQGETGQTGATGPAGRDGTNGTDGVDGISPIATISKSGDTATISITDKNGTTTATVKDGTNGINGTNGRDGYVQYTAGNNITIENNVISAVGGSGTPDNITTRLNNNEELETIGIYTQQNSARKVWEGNLSQYNAIQEKDSDTYYYITDDYFNNGLPSAGTTGQVLAKASNNDYDTEWVPQHNFTHETWTFTLDDETTVDKEVVLW